MKIPLGGNSYLEPDEGPRTSRWHMAIVETARIPNTRVGHWATLSCGHRVMLFGDPALAGGVAMCTACRDAAEKEQV